MRDPLGVHVERARVDSRGRSVIPRRLMEELKLEEVLMTPQEDGVSIRKASDPEGVLKRLLGA